MITVFASFYPNEKDVENVKKILQGMVEPTRNEEGNVTYDLYSMDDLEKHRSNISYTMNNEDSEKYNNYIELEKIKEQQRLKKIEKRDMGILKKYRKLNNIMLEK